MPWMDEIRHHHVELASYEIGRHYTTCPQCSASRKGAHKKLKCLGVTIAADKFFGGCNHCGWTFPEVGFRGAAVGAMPPPDNRTYHNYGAELRKVRNPPGKTPKCYWEHRDTGGYWVSGTGGLETKSLLYRIDEAKEAIAAGEVVLIVEGEGDVDTCWKLGFAATCNAHGASEPGKAAKWTKAHSSQLRGAHVVVLNDNDIAGYAHAEAACKHCLGIAASVKRLDLKDSWPGIPDGGDISDWARQAPAAAAELEKLVEGAVERVARARPQAAAPGAPAANWLSLCILSDGRTPRVLSVVENASIGLIEDPAFAGKLTFNEMAQRPVLVNSAARFVEDDDITIVQRKLQRLGLKTVSRDTTAQAIDHIARQRKFHPVRDYLDGLKWDGEDRAKYWLHAYLGVEDTAYASEIGRLFLISMIARVFQPGCKADYMLILEGPQGKEKSKACAVLAGEEYFSDHLPDLTNGKDVSVHLRGKWLIEVPELHAFNKAEATLLKSFLSRQRELYRPPYGKTDVDEPRQCVFIGTSNKDAYLRDETGGRRFWPVKCGVIEIELLKANRDQLLAEALAAYRERADWWPTPEFEAEHIKPEQDARFEHDTWTEAIERWLEKHPILTDTSGNPVKDSKGEMMTAPTVTVREIARECLKLEDGKHDPRMEKRIISVLQQLGWKPYRTAAVRKWERP